MSLGFEETKEGDTYIDEVIGSLMDTAKMTSQTAERYYEKYYDLVYDCFEEEIMPDECANRILRREEDLGETVQNVVFNESLTRARFVNEYMGGLGMSNEQREKQGRREGIDLVKLFDMIEDGKVYEPAPSKYDPDVLAVNLPNLNSIGEILYHYDLIGGTDVYGVSAIDKSGQAYYKDSDIAGGQLDKEEIQQIIYDMSDQFSLNKMRPNNKYNSTDEYVEWYKSYKGEE
jgi:hypothetical protein